MHNPTHTHGFTLIELMLYTSIFAVILLAVSSFLAMLLSSYVYNQTINEVEQQGSYVMRVISKTVRNANAIKAPEKGGQADVLNLKTSPISTDPTIFDATGGTIRVTEGSNSPIPLTTNKVSVNSLVFYNVSGDWTLGAIKIQFTLNYNNPNNRKEYNYSKTFYGSAVLRGGETGWAYIPSPKTEADNLIIDASGAKLVNSNSDLTDIKLENAGSEIITVDYITLSWTSASRLINAVSINSIVVWSSTGPGTPKGAQPKGTELNIQNIALSPGAPPTPITYFRFNGSMTGNTFNITFEMTDGSKKTVAGVAL